tara:strand:- start:390 stop:635 length:246 start_codon:yes stop_codon:yes gene_type:complete
MQRWGKDGERERVVGVESVRLNMRGTVWTRPATHGNHKERRTPTAKFKLLIRLAAEEAREGAEGESVTEMSEHSGCSAVEK